MKKFEIRQFGVGTLIRCSPIISADSKYLLTIGDNCVYVWIVETGESLRSINVNWNSSDHQTIVSFALNPNNRLQLCVGQKNGVINVWDYEDGILIQTIKLQIEIVEMYSIANRALFIFGKNDTNVFSLRQIESIRHYSSSIVLFDKLPCSPKSISFDQKGNFAVFLNIDGTIIYLLNLLTIQMKIFPLSKQNLSYHGKISCAQIHPFNECLALGSQSGRIALCFDLLNSTRKEATVSYLHWHSLPILSLSFSFDGSYLLSGGHECVLVKWLYRTSEPTFLPRLAAPIVHLTCSNDQTFYISTHLDNTVHIITSHLSIQQTIAGISQMFLPHQSLLPAGICVLMRERAIVMNSGKVGHLQFISIDHGKLLYNLDIVGENYVCSNEMTSQCVLTDIKRLAIDSTDNWLITFEERSSNCSNDDHQNERKLRFWKFDFVKKQFCLNTTITFPHGQETLNQMLFHPNKLELATTGNDGFVKIWTFVQQNSLTKRECHWRCLSGHCHQSCESNALCYYELCSSIVNQYHLCCSFQHLVTVWTDQTSDINEESRYEYSRCFAHFDRSNVVKSIHFGCNTILVCHSTLVNLWNCVNGQFLRSFPWHVHSIAKDPRSNFISLFDRNFLHFYSFIDGKCHSRKSSLFRRVTSSIYIPNDKSSSFVPFQHSRLIFSIPDQGFKCLFDDEEENEEERNSNLIGEKENLLSKLIVQSQNDFNNNSNPNDNSFEDLRKMNEKLFNRNCQLFCTASYLLPSIDNYCVESLKQMLLPNDIDKRNDLSIIDSSRMDDELSIND